MFLHTCGYCEHIWVEDDVEGIHSHLFGEYAVSPLSYLYPTLVSSGLSLLVKTHHHHGGTVAHHVAGVAHKRLLALLQ